MQTLFQCCCGPGNHSLITGNERHVLDVMGPVDMPCTGEKYLLMNTQHFANAKDDVYDSISTVYG